MFQSKTLYGAVQLFASRERLIWAELAWARQVIDAADRGASQLILRRVHMNAVWHPIHGSELASAADRHCAQCVANHGHLFVLFLLEGSSLKTCDM